MSPGNDERGPAQDRVSSSMSTSDNPQGTTSTTSHRQGRGSQPRVVVAHVDQAGVVVVCPWCGLLERYPHDGGLLLAHCGGGPYRAVLRLRGAA